MFLSALIHEVSVMVLHTLLFRSQSVETSVSSADEEVKSKSPSLGYTYMSIWFHSSCVWKWIPTSHFSQPLTLNKKVLSITTNVYLMTDSSPKTIKAVAKLEEWLSSLPEHPPSSNMMLWMSRYSTQCPRACCYSPDCACIRCDNCRSSLTSNGVPAPRNICMECELAFSEDMSDFLFQVPSLTLCDNCFDMGACKHQHTQFCRVNELGEHATRERIHGVSDLRKLSPSDFPAVKVEGEHACCQCCFEKFKEPDVIAVAAPGCMHDHGLPIENKNEGVSDSKTYMCRTCSFQYLVSRNEDTYCDIGQYCTVCSHIVERDRWTQEFRKEAENSFSTGSIVELSNRKAQLIQLHPQLWIQSIVIDEFEKVRMREEEKQENNSYNMKS